MLKHLTHILLDGARMGNAMGEARARNKTAESLYRGENIGMLGQVAPQLFTFSIAAPFGQWCLKTGFGQSWGVMLKSAWPMTELHKHFRKFLTVKAENGRSLFFRFYDPRVLRIFLPSCDAAQLREFFGGAVDYFVVEDEDPAFALRFYHQNGVLQTERCPVKDEIAALPGAIPLPPPAQDPLPPEAIAALEAAGYTLADVGLAPATETASAPEPAEAVAPVESSAPDPKPAPAPKAKTKWNAFE